MIIAMIFGILVATGAFDEPAPVINQLDLSRETRYAFNAYANYLYDGEIVTTTFDASQSTANTALQKMADNDSSDERKNYFEKASELQTALERASYRDHPYEETNPESEVYTFQHLVEDLHQSMVTLENLVAPTEPTSVELIEYLRSSSVEVSLGQVMRRYANLESDESLYNTVQKYYNTQLILLEFYMENGCVSAENVVDASCSYRVSSASPSKLASHQSAATAYQKSRESAILAPLKLCVKLNALVNKNV